MAAISGWKTGCVNITVFVSTVLFEEEFAIELDGSITTI